MKKAILLFLWISLLLTVTACGAKKISSPATTLAPVTAPTESITDPTTAPTEPEWEPGTIRAGDMGMLWTIYQRGDQVTVIGKLDNYYIIEDAETDHLVDDRFLRLDDEEIPEESTGYARYKTMVHTTAYLDSEEPVALPFNKKVTVLDSHADWMYIQWEEGSGYVLASQISRWPISSGGSSDDDDGGGGYSGGGGGSNGQDGSDVNLGALSSFGGDYGVKLLGTYLGSEYEKLDSCVGTVLSDGAEGYFQLLRRGDEVKVVAVGDDSCTLYLGGLEADVPRWAVALQNDEAYEAWEAYARWNTIAYSDFRCTAELAKFSTNQRVNVVDELTEMELYVVDVDGEIGYIPLDKLSQYPARSQSSDDSDGGGGSSGAEWTPPIL